MKLSANTSLYRERPDGERWSIEQAVRAVAKAGFEAVELNFAEAIRPGSFFAEKNWETEIERIGLAAEECGRMEAALRASAIENEPNPAKFTWQC